MRSSGSGNDLSYASLTTPRPSHESDLAGSDIAGVRTPTTSMLQSMASFLGLQIESTFFCQICYDEVPLSQSHQLRECGHRFCTMCLQSYLAFNVHEGETDLRCFFHEVHSDAVEQKQEKSCSAAISEADLRLLVDHATWTKYSRFQFNKQHTNARQCPYCDHSQLCGSAATTDCECESCGRVFCFVHGNAHPNQSCSSYQRRVRKVEKLSMATIHQLCKCCPGCGQFVEKSGGCNQIKCSVCKTSFCWLCREVIDDSTFPIHFQWWNIRGCAGNQMRNMDETTPCDRVGTTIVRGLFFLVFGPPALVLTTVATVLFCCWYPCKTMCAMSFRQAFTSCLCVCGYIVLSPFVMVGGLLFVPCLCVALCASQQSFGSILSSPRNESTTNASSQRMDLATSGADTKMPPNTSAQSPV